ncbi:MAG: HD domain-containing protein [Sulfuritalea sp.]|nr:HD domain-containing protein [Sulfuritalea sp.]
MQGSYALDATGDRAPLQSLRSRYGTSLDELLAVPALARLRGVGFIGVTARVFGCTDSNRFNHSLAVADLAVRLASRLGLDPVEQDAYFLYHLFHDVGHMANSHVTEPTIRLFHSGAKFHEAIGRAEARDDPALLEWCLDGTEGGQRVWDLVVKLWAGKFDTCSGTLRELLSAALNPDSVEGMCRSAAILDIACPSPQSVLDGIACGSAGLEYQENYLPVLQEYWLLHSSVYQDYVFSLANQSAEAMWKKAICFAVSDGSISATSDFLRYTDQEAETAIQASSRGSDLLRMLQSGAVLSPLWVAPREKVWSAEAAAAAASIQSSFHSLIEFEETIGGLMRDFGIQSSIVAPHFTRLRRFIVDFGGLVQPALFNRSLAGAMQLIEVRKSPGLVPLAVFGEPVVDTSALILRDTCDREDTSGFGRAVWDVITSYPSL